LYITHQAKFAVQEPNRFAKMPTAEGSPQTLYDKVLQDHIVDEAMDGTLLVYIGMYNLW
jgi:hypothetical protein